MLLEKERVEIVAYGKRLYQSGLTHGTSGNISVYSREKGLYAITPSGMPYLELFPEDVVVMDMEGRIVEGKRKPSSEIHLHSILYKERADINAVIHAHTVYATAIACLQENLPAVDYMIAAAGKTVRCAEYATFGTEQLALNAAKAMEGSKAVLLANHGVVTGDDSLEKAYNILEEVEYVSELYYRSRAIGTPVIIGDKEMDTIVDKFKTYGQ